MKNWKKIRKAMGDFQGVGGSLASKSLSESLVNKFLVREKVTDAIRLFFKSEGFREVETPLLVQKLPIIDLMEE